MEWDPGRVYRTCPLHCVPNAAAKQIAAHPEGKGDNLTYTSFPKQQSADTAQICGGDTLDTTETFPRCKGRLPNKVLTAKDMEPWESPTLVFKSRELLQPPLVRWYGTARTAQGGSQLDFGQTFTLQVLPPGGQSIPRERCPPQRKHPVVRFWRENMIIVREKLGAICASQTSPCASLLAPSAVAWTEQPPWLHIPWPRAGSAPIPASP